MSLSSPSRALDSAAAVAGGLFFAITSFFMLGAVVWAALSALSAPLAAIGAAELIAGLAALIVGVLVTRNALRLANGEAA